MQTIYLDISNKGVIPCIEAKQTDVGRKFLAIITDAGVPFNIQNSTQISVWFDGDSGVGNYSDIDGIPAISIDGNKITITLIEQMLKNAGDGILCMLLNDANGSQIGLWNIPYSVQYVPGLGSEKATEYFTAFSASAAQLAGAALEIKEKQERIDNQIKTRNKSAAGLIYPLASDRVPDGFLLCDGSAYSRTEYAELFEAIGTVYGNGDGSTTFNVPNLSTRVPVGSGDGYDLGATGGEAEHTLSVNEMPSHSHVVGIDDPDKIVGHSAGTTEGDRSAYFSPGSIIEGGRSGTFMAREAGGGEPYSIMQPYTVVNYIISTGKEIEFVIGGSNGGSGIDGTTFYPSVSNQGVISWTNDGGKENPEPVNLVSAVISALPVYNGEVESV